MKGPIDLGTVTDVATPLLALFAFVLSVVTYFRTEKRTQQESVRLFLDNSLLATRQLATALQSFLDQMDAGVFENDVVGAARELTKLEGRSLQWRQERFYQEFESLLGAVKAFDWNGPFGMYEFKGRKMPREQDAAKAILAHCRRYIGKALESLA